MILWYFNHKAGGAYRPDCFTVRNTKIDKKATILREQTDMGGKYDSNTVSVKWGTDSYGNYYIYILVDGTAVCALPGWTRLD